MANTTTIEQGGRPIGTIGTVGRIILGVFLVTVALWGPGWWGDGAQWHEAVLGLAGFPAAMLALQFAPAAVYDGAGFKQRMACGSG